MSPRALAFVAVSGALFGFGLALSTMVKPEVVIAFLMWRDMDSFGKHPSRMSARTLLGAAIFGIGWGLTGVCPGPAIAGLGVGNWPLLLSLAGLAAGGLIQGLFFAPEAP